ncbi:16434_t:CDS:2 [Cetraspora pellucida]|uniref:16434_t:CDS:1 n=1 Tax=Cetraspora pellucida TaxID=1433469 RepID=A0A9N9HRP8_9GLOM|nr:16434_t:CDS:2 [Cetraspora pellucida]
MFHKNSEIANSVTFKSDEKRISSDNKDVEHEYNYGVFIKLENVISLPAKWYTVKVSAVDELLSEIHSNIETLIKKSIEASDYRVAFKPEKGAGAGTQLMDAQDFKKFQMDYNKYTLKNISMVFLITFIGTSLNLTRKKIQHVSEDNSNEDFTTTFKNKNRIPKTSNLSSKESIMANRAKENHIEITFMMLSIWASEMQPVYSGQPYAVSPFYNSFQMFPLYISSQIYRTPFQTSIQMPSQSAIQTSSQSATSITMTLPTIGDFLKQVDESEDTGNYYQNFLLKLEQQRILVRLLSKLSDENFEKCGIDTIGARETLREYATN